MKEEIEIYDELVSESEGELSSLFVGSKPEEPGGGEDGEDTGLSLQAFLGLGRGAAEVLVNYDPPVDDIQPGPSRGRRPRASSRRNASSEDLTLENFSSQALESQLQPELDYSTGNKKGEQRMTKEAADAVAAALEQKANECPLCPYTTTRHYILVRHLRVHTGEKPYPCPHCPYRGTDKGNLNVHMRRHTGTKPYECPYCAARFTQNVHLKDHMRTHTGEKPYACPHCDFCSRNSSGLNRHLKIYHGRIQEQLAREGAAYQ